MAFVEPVPIEQPIPVDNVGQLLTNALQDAQIVGLGEDIETGELNKAFRYANWLLAQWARKRWLVYRIQDYSFVSSGANTYPVGSINLAKTVGININPRPDRLEYAFLRFVNQSPPGGLQVDIPLDIIQSHEDYSRITVKTVGTLPWRIFYDPAWPIGVLHPWPVPQATIYEIHCGFKVVLPRFSSLQQPINFPPEYEAALNFCLIRRFKAAWGLPSDPEINSLARDALNVMREANSAMGTLVMPPYLRNRNRAYDYRGDTDSY
jgi:hypothetical protein